MTEDQNAVDSNSRTCCLVGALERLWFVTWVVFIAYIPNAAINVNSVPPLVRHSTLGGKSKGPDFNTFSPGTEYHFARNSFFLQVWRLGAHHFFPVVKERPGIRHQYYWLQINIIHVEFNCVVDLPRDRRGYHLPINDQHTSYVKLSVHCAFEEGFIGLCFVFDALTIDNSTGIRQKLKQSVPRYSTNLLRIIWVGSTVKKYLVPRDSMLNLRRPLTRGVHSSHWPLHRRLTHLAPHLSRRCRLHKFSK
jgi:hypothetical protein